MHINKAGQSHDDPRLLSDPSALTVRIVLNFSPGCRAKKEKEAKGPCFDDDTAEEFNQEQAV